MNKIIFLFIILFSISITYLRSQTPDSVVIDRDFKPTPQFHFALLKIVEENVSPPDLELNLVAYASYYTADGRDSVHVEGGKIRLAKCYLSPAKNKSKLKSEIPNLKIGNTEFEVIPYGYLYLNYYPANNSTLAKEMKLNKEITNSYIDNFEATPLFDSVIKHDIKFKNCILKDFSLNKNIEKRMKVYGETRFIDCNFIGFTEFDNTDFLSSVAFINSTNLIGNTSIRFFNSTFINNFIFFTEFNEYHTSKDCHGFFNYRSEILDNGYYGNTQVKANFQLDNNVFYGFTYLYNTVSSSYISMTDCSFNKQVMFEFADPYFDSSNITSKMVRKEIIHDFWYDKLLPYYNLSSIHCNYNANVFMNKMKYINCNMNNSIMSGALSFFKSQIDSTSDFKNLFFLGNKQNIYTDNVTFSLADLGINNPSILNVTFPFKNTTDTTLYSNESRTICNDFYSRLKIAASIRFKDRNEILAEFNDKTEHTKTLYEISYYWNNRMLFYFLWYGFLEIIVRNGYHGEWNFFVTSFSIILFFSAIYFVKFKNESIRYLSMYGYKAIGRQKYSANNDLRTALRCLWISFWVFLNPKLPLQYFQLKKGLFYFFVLEWFIGTFLMILFLIFIASKYPFIKALFG